MLFTPSAGQCVLDIGANDGTYAERYAQAVGPTGYVYCVEPNPLAFTKARRRLASYPWVSVVEMAVAEEDDEERSFYCDEADTRHSSLWAQNVLHAPLSCAVWTDTVDAFVYSHMIRYPDWIKVDAQGAEALILAGAPRTLDAKLARWCVEVWSHGLLVAGASVDDVVRPFAARGYRPELHGQWTTWDAVTTAANSKKKHGSIDVVCVPPQSSE